jgi:tetratricopeptide (TPR) repeat protein
MDSLMRRPLLLVPALLVCAGPGFGQAADIRTKTREYEDVRITQDDIRGVEGRQGAGRLTFSVAEVVSVSYRQAPDAYRKAYNAYRDGQYEVAAKRFQEALEAGGNFPWLPAYANYHLGESLSRIGEAAEAQAAYERVLAIEPKPRFVPECYLALVDLHLRKGKAGAEEARKLVEGLNKVVQANKALAPRYAPLAELAQARIMIRSGEDVAKALISLESLLARAGEDKDVINQIRLEMGHAFLGLKDHRRAEGAFRGIVESATESRSSLDILSGAWNGLGDALFAQEKYDEAGLIYSKTYVFCLEVPHLRERAAHALYFGGRAFLFQAGREENPELKDQLQKRARRLMMKAARDFAGTSGGERAAREQGLR